MTRRFKLATFLLTRTAAAFLLVRIGREPEVVAVRLQHHHDAAQDDLGQTGGNSLYISQANHRRHRRPGAGPRDCANQLRQRDATLASWHLGFTIDLAHRDIQGHPTTKSSAVVTRKHVPRVDHMPLHTPKPSANWKA